MKKLFQLGAVFCGILVTQYGYTQNFRGSCGTQSQAGQYQDYSADRPCEDQPVQNDCWTLYLHYEPCYYTTQRCVEEQIPCKKKCCRYVDKYYEVERCKYVPQYYKETRCKKCPEYYEVEDCKTCKKWVSDQHCKYVPKYYWKHASEQVNNCPPVCN